MSPEVGAALAALYEAERKSQDASKAVEDAVSEHVRAQKVLFEAKEVRGTAGRKLALAVEADVRASRGKP